ncbi:MAG: DNA polymerase III subunit beta, partial [Candidatus Paceibacterales bacterium]
NIVLESLGNDLKIETENYHTSIKTLPAEEFPLIPSVENGRTIALDSQDLKNSLDQVVFAASTNQTQPEISGVLFGYNESGLVVAATDRYRLAEKKLEVKEKQNGEHQAIIPQKTLLELSRIIGNQKGLVEMVFNETQVSLSFNDTQIISRLIDGQYPDYKQIIPVDFKTVVVTEKQALVNALRAVAVFSQSSNSAKFNFSAAKQMLILAAESSELGKSQVELPAKIEGVDVEVVLNHHYVLDSLASIDSANIIMKIIDDNSPSLILPEGKNDYIYLVMPIKS